MPTALGTIASHRTAPVAVIPMMGLVGWWDAADAATITASTGAVSQLNDKSVNGNHLTQGTATNKPITGTQTMNGRNVLRFDGVDDHLTRPNAQIVNAATGEWTIIAALRFTGTSGAQNPVDGDNGAAQRAAQFMRVDGGSPLIVVFNSVGGLNTESPGGVFTAGVGGVLTVVVTSTTVESWLNGTSNGSSALTGSRYVGVCPMTFGGSLQGSIVQVFNGDIAEVVAYNRALPTVERQQVESYVKNKWGTP